MEPIGFFTSRADLPADALAISATTHLDAANILAAMIREYSGEDVATSMLQHIVPDVFVQYEPEPGAPAAPALTPGELYCYRNKEGLEHLFDILIWYDSFDLGGLAPTPLVDRRKN